MTLSMRQRYTRHYRRRGTVYLAVLAVAMIVTTIGLSGLLALRIRQSNLADSEAATIARITAASYVERTMLSLALDDNWKSNTPDDTWTGTQQWGRATCSYKVVEERASNLMANGGWPVRIYGRSEVGDVVRIYSVLFRPPGSPEIPNLLENGTFEDGMASWTGRGFCTLTPETDNPAEGSTSCLASGRYSYWSGPVQAVTNKLTNGQTYYTEAWLKNTAYFEPMKLTLHTRSTGSGERWHTVWIPVAGGSWQKVAGTFTVQWVGDLEYAYWYAETWVTNQNFFLDEAILVEGTELPEPQVSNDSFGPVAGSWRREVLP